MAFLNSSKEIADLKEKLQASEESLATANASVETLKAEHASAIEALNGQLSTAQASIAELTTAKTKAEADLTQYKADFETRVETAAQARVVELASAAGIEPVKQDQSAGADPDAAPKAGEGLTGIAKARAGLAAKMKK